MKRVLIMTPAFLEFNPGYSLTSIVKDQTRMLVEHGDEVMIVVGERYTDTSGWTAEFGDKVSILCILPHADLIDYHTKQDLTVEHTVVIRKTITALVHVLQYADVAFTHDIVFTGWNLPFYLALESKEIADTGVPFYHWVHSIPNQNYDWWDINLLPWNHKLVSPNRVYRQGMAEAWRGTQTKVVTIPHIKDIRVFLDFGEEAKQFIRTYPKALQADIIQVYPASSDRLRSKRLEELILIFAEFKRRGFSVCLICANQWATGRQRKEDLNDYIDTAMNCGLSPQEFIFTSLWNEPLYENGISQRFLKDLYALGNVFIFPTISESFGLVLPEALLASGALPVINAHLEVLTEITQTRGLRLGFGSFNQELSFSKQFPKAEYYKNVAAAVINKMLSEESIATRTVIRQEYNYDQLYDSYYWPLLYEAPEEIDDSPD